MEFKHLEQFLKRFYQDYPKEKVPEKAVITLDSDKNLATMFTQAICLTDGYATYLVRTGNKHTFSYDNITEDSIIIFPNDDHKIISVVPTDEDSCIVVDADLRIVVILKKPEVYLTITHEE